MFTNKVLVFCVGFKLLNKPKPSSYILENDAKRVAPMYHQGNQKKGGEMHIYMWPALPKPSTYAHHGNEQYSLSMDSSINKLTDYQYTTAKC